MNFKNNILLLVMSMMAGVSFAQTKVKVVTITKTEIFDWNEKTSLVVNGERAEISIVSHDKPTIECEVKLISKHPDAAIAKKEVEFHQWVVEKIGRKILLRNFIEIPNGMKKPEGNLKTVYEIKLPRNCKLDVNNYFGKIELTGLQSDIAIKNDFSKVYLNDVYGKVDMTTKFGDITANGVGGEITIASNRGDINLTDIKGDFDLNVSGAAVSVLQKADIEEFTLIGKKSNIIFDISSIKEYNFELETEQVEIIHPPWMVFEGFEKKDNKKWHRLSRSKTAGNISVSIQYGKLEFAEHTGSH